jgi:hypothetical protein
MAFLHCCSLKRAVDLLCFLPVSGNYTAVQLLSELPAKLPQMRRRDKGFFSLLR